MCITHFNIVHVKPSKPRRVQSFRSIPSTLFERNTFFNYLWVFVVVYKHII